MQRRRTRALAVRNTVAVAVVVAASAASAAGATAAPTISVDGAVSDALYVKGAGEIWLTTADKNGRRLVRVNAKAQPAGGTLVAAKEAVFVDACPDGRV